MGTEDRHEEDLFPPDPSREGAAPESEEPEEDFFVLEEEDEEGRGEPAGEESGREEEEALEGPPAPGAGPEEEGPSGEEPGPEDFLEGEVDESLFEEGPASGEPGEAEVFVQEPPGSEEEALVLDGEGEPGPGAEESDLEGELFDDLETGDSSGEDFGVELPSFQEEGKGEEDLLEALEDFDPEEVHDAPRGGDSTGELDDLGLDLDLEADLELVDEVEDLVSPSSESREPGGPPVEEDALELVLEEDSGQPEMMAGPEDAGETEMVLREDGTGPEGEDAIDESLFEEGEPPESFTREDTPSETSMEEEAAGETPEEGSPEFLDGDVEEEVTPAGPLLSSFEGEPEGSGTGETPGEAGGVAPWMVPEEVLEETPDGLAAAPTEEAILGQGGEEEELPEIGLRPIEEEEPYPDEDAELSGESEQQEPPTFEELYGLPGPTEEGGGGGSDVETSDSVIVEAPKVVGSIYQEEEHGWGVKLILWGSLAASLAAGAFVGWAYMKQKASLSVPGKVFTARVEMPKPALPDHAPPPDLRPKEQTAWKPYQGAGEIPPPLVAGKSEETPQGPPVPSVTPPAGQEGRGKLAGGPGAKPAPPPAPVRPPSPEPPGPTKAGKTEPSKGGGEHLAQGETGKSAGAGGKEPGRGGEPTPVKPGPAPLAQTGPGGETPVPVEPSGPAQPARPAGPETQPPAAPPASSGAASEPKGWKDALGLVRGTQILAELKNGNYFIGRIYKIGGRKVVLDVKKGQLTFYYDEVAHLMPIGPALARKLKEHPTGFVILKNTNRLKGEIVVEAKDYVTIQVREARITIPRESIQRVEKGKETSLKLKDDPVLAKELGMDDIPVEEEKPQPKPQAAPLHPSEPSIPSGAVEELDRLLGAARQTKEKDKESKGLSLPSPKEGKVKVRADG